MSEEYRRQIEIFQTLNTKISPSIYDDFERAAIAPWTAQYTGGTGDTDIAAAAAYAGSNGMKMLTRALTPAIGDRAGARRRAAFYNGKTIKTGITAKRHTASGSTIFQITIWKYINGNGMEFKFRYRPANSDLQISDNNVWTTIATGVNTSAEWFSLEITINIPTNNYISLKFNNEEYDISQYVGYLADGGIVEEYLMFDLWAEAVAAVASQGYYVDNFYYYIF